ncbi:aminotransferase class I/II-fold pyridoxal phosphate-dependent enzyme [bacterium]|nr:aminotransferase class I/II-fold pyridoxal phosphate-dependent enzyme [bacterium]
MTQSIAAPRLSKKIQSLQGGAESSFVRMVRMASSVPDLISLGRGDPDVPTPPHIVEAALRVIQSQRVNYTAPVGMPELREAIAHKLKVENGLTYDPATEVIVTAGAQEAMSVVMQTLLDPGDEVLLPDPYYTAYEMAIGLTGGVVKRVPTAAEDDFEVKVDAIEACITPRSRVLVLVSPNNPTGAVISAATLAQIAELVLKHNLIVISDELYEKIIFDGAEAPSIVHLPGMFERTIIINGFSKTYCMTGFRVGYLAGPAALVTPMQEVHHTLTICAPTASQHAALAALTGSQDCVIEIVGIFAARRRVLLDALTRAGIPYPQPAGAFFAFADIRKTGLTSADFAMKALTEAAVLVFPGTQYGPGGEGFLRISYLAEPSAIETAVARLGDVF